jgi:hypothetical protein
MNPDRIQQIRDFVEMYEPYAFGLAEDLIVDLPTWIPAEDMIDNWQTSAWESAKHF